MAMKQSRSHGQAFTTLVGNFPYGADPSHNMAVFQTPTPLRQAITSQVVGFRDGGVHAQNVNALISGTVAAKTAAFTVNNNDFSTGMAVLVLGEYELVSGIDFAIGATAGATAINLCAAISRLPGFSATPTGANVAVEYDAGPVNVVDFYVLYYGTITNYTSLAPATGVMANGTPNISAPTLT